MAFMGLMSFSQSKLISIIVVLFVLSIYFREALYTTFVIASLPITWKSPSSDFFISEERDHFDLTFSNYSIDQQSSLPEYPDLVPPILHQIALGGQLKEEWLTARSHCIEHHYDWETRLWTNENASSFVQEKFPHLKAMWDGYKYPIQRVDALRYMILYEYGGVVLDMDLDCRRSLAPLQRFGFVAPAAHPIGFSNGMMMAAKGHPFVGELLRNLPIYDRNWLGLPYATVMFSTGCHYASSIHSIQSNRTDLKILSGPESSPLIHRLNGDVITPLFHHLGASSWHSYDASLIMSLGKLRSPVGRYGVGLILGMAVLILSVLGAILRLRLVRARRLGRIQLPPDSPTHIDVAGFKLA